MPVGNCPCAEELSAFVLGTLPEPVLEQIAQHIDSCSVCEAAVQSLDQLSDPLLAGLQRAPASGHSMVARRSPRASDTSEPGRLFGPRLPEKLGDYRIVRELGRGGMGIVYEAVQVSLGRQVAVKVLPGQAMLDGQAVERFRREARAAGRLHHTNIVPIFGTGEQDGLQYFVMQLIPGPGLDQVLRELGRRKGLPESAARPANSAVGRPGAETSSASQAGTLSALVQQLLAGQLTGSNGASAEDRGSKIEDRKAIPDPQSSILDPQPSSRAYWVSVARLGIQVADALAFAHARGVVHRDVKPSNLLLDPSGRFWITDFGLAKEVASPDNLTRSDHVIGTLRYVPPERFGGNCDVRGDVYGLGLTLYELLTLRPAFPATDRAQLLRQVIHAEPPRPRRLNPAVPRDLETIVLKAIARDPAHRYQTAADLAEDLRRFVADRPIRARRFTPLELLWRACRRDPVRAALLGTLLLVCVAGVLGVASQWWRAEIKAQASTEAREQAMTAVAQAHRNLYFNQIAQARLEWRLNNVAGAEQLLDQCEPKLRGWEWHYLRGVNRADLLSLPTSAMPILTGVAFSPDGRRLAVTGWDPYAAPGSKRAPAVAVWDLDSGQRLPVPPGLPEGLGLSFRPDGQLLAATDANGKVLLWRPATGEKIASWEAAGTATFSPDGKLLAAGGTTEVIVWDATTRQPVYRFASRGGRVTFRPDGLVLAVSGPEAVVLRDVVSGKEIQRLPHGRGEAAVRGRRYFGSEGPDLAFSPDGSLVVVATTPPRLWDAVNGRRLHTLNGHDFDVSGVAFSPDGRHVATAGSDGTVRLWDVQTGAEGMVWRGHRGPVSRVAFHPEGWCLASVGRQPGDVKLWDLTRNPEYLNLPNVNGQALAFPAGSQPPSVTVVGIQGDLQRCDIETGRTVVQAHVDLIQKWLTPACPAAFSGDGRWLVVVSGDRRVVKVLQAADGRERKALRGLTVPGLFVAASHDGTRVAAAALDNQATPRAREIRVWDADEGKTLCDFRPAIGPTRFVHGIAALSPDGSRLAFDDYTGTKARVRVVAVADGRELLSLSLGEAIVLCVTFSADGRLLAAGDEKGAIAVWDGDTGDSLYDRRLHGPSFRLAFSPDGRRLAGVDRDQAKVWDIVSGGDVLTLRGAPPRPNDGGFNPVVAWSPDGRWLAMGQWDGSVSLWDASDRRQSAGTALALRQVAVGRAYHWHLQEAEAAVEDGQAAAAIFHLERLLGREPPDNRARLRRAYLLAQRGLTERAAADFQTAFAVGEPLDGGFWLAHARVLLARGDLAGYRRLCTRMLAVTEPGLDASWKIQVARVGSLGPEAVKDVAGVIVQPAQKTLASAPADAELLFLVGLAHYRAGQWAKAAARLEEAAAASSNTQWRVWPVLAMTHYRQRHAREAQRWLAKATGQHEEFARHLAQPAAGFALSPAWMDFDVLYAEARNLLD